MIRIRGFVVLSFIAAIAGCASGPKPAPEPDMTRLVVVNKTVPPELLARPGPAAPVKKGGEK